MSYEDPIEAALRALTQVEWRKRKDVFEARINKTHATGILQMLGDHRIVVSAEVSEARSGRYIASVSISEIPMIMKAVATTKTPVKPSRRKRQG